MRRSKSYLPDVNFWLALAADNHQFHPAATNWFRNAPSGSLAFCRVTQLGLLRLLTNPKVMGEFVLQHDEAWAVYAQLLRDRRVRFEVDSIEVEAKWRIHSSLPLSAHNLWTDSYLAAFAAVRGWTVVTFDKALAGLGGDEPDTLLLVGYQ